MRREWVTVGATGRVRFIRRSIASNVAASESSGGSSIARNADKVVRLGAMPPHLGARLPHRILRLQAAWRRS